MATVHAASAAITDHQRRPKTSVLKSFIHKRTASKGTTLPSEATDSFAHDAAINTKLSSSAEYSCARPLEEIQVNQHNQGSRTVTSKDGGGPPTTKPSSKSLHKKTKSIISLRSLVGRDPDAAAKSDSTSLGKPKKTKSSTTLTAFLTRPKSSKSMKTAVTQEEVYPEKDKENQAPGNASSSESATQPPIYAAFASRQYTTQPLGGKFIENEIDLYTPKEYSPGKQRNFHDGPGSQPTLGQGHGKTRPVSTFLPTTYSIHDITKFSNVPRRSADQPRQVSSETQRNTERKKIRLDSRQNMILANHGSRAMAAVAAFGVKAKSAESHPMGLQDIKDVDIEFEAMLDRRNIPENQRYKMRSLAVSMKKDFIRQDWAETAATQPNQSASKDSHAPTIDANDKMDDADLKMKRPRSKTFTLSRSSKEPSSPSKKSRPESTIRSHSRTKSSDSTSSYGKSFTSTSAAVASNLLAKAKGQVPDDFVAYIRKVQKPELVEVGKLHKLRLLLRNETVNWTDEFIGLGGMSEIVGLLYRTLEIEWREEHEDALLHEVLLCLKALCTTELALEQLNEIQGTLFPVLIHMLFDEEKKGPSEFTTRNIATSVLFTYLKSAPLRERSQRSQVLLSYLKDPEPNEEERPVGFVLEMRRERPYRIWSKEVSNVAKEVFWIFLHKHNVVSLSASSDSKSTMDGNSEREAEAGILSISAAVSNSASFDAFNHHHLYMVKYFPPERPPVPAAPYVGGVEWDATNYIASHLDLVNGIICSLETAGQRNALREQLRVSGWEKCMGSTLRRCKEKFYGSVHAGLKSWVAAASADGWDIRDVSYGPESEPKSPMRLSPAKQKMEAAPKLEIPKLDFGRGRKDSVGEDWL